MFRKLLVANRGEIAVRVMKACRELGIATVALYSEADTRALHVLTAGEAVCIGPPPAADSYLNISAIVAAARATGAEAVHPGYGFLSENPEFAEACLAAGLVWVGPPPAAMRAMASKIQAKRLAADLGVPLLPGYQGDDQDERALTAAAARTGYPLLIKAAAGGGGRGMRVVERPEEFAEALESARREARAAFGDDAVLLERYVRRPRHIEIQVFGDAYGSVVHLGERECSVQRRHQKVIEESPSPALTPALREQMGEAAVRLARAIGYVGAGTVEFIVPSFAPPLQSQPGINSQLATQNSEPAFAFLEMNTRLQVEHGVTELATGLDLVQLQLRVAAGEPLPVGQADVRVHGHAIECRIYAEDPARGYLPSAGRLARFAPPDGPGIRNDAGFYEGAEVPPYYDAMLAKLLVWGEDRAEAIARTADALDRYQIAGVADNLALLRAAVRHPDFAAGRISTRFLDDEVLPSLADDVPPVAALLGAAAYDLLGPVARAGDPWAAGPWRPAGTPVGLAYLYNGAEHAVVAGRQPDGTWELTAGERAHRLTLEPGVAGKLLLRAGAATTAVTVEPDGNALRVTAGGRTVMLARRGPPTIAATSQTGVSAGGARTLTAPLAGVVVKVAVAEGDAVQARQALVVLEAMKMEHTIEAPATGAVRRLHRAPGDRVQAGDPLVELDSA